MRTKLFFLVVATAIFLSACGNQTTDQRLDQLVEVVAFTHQSATRVMDYPGQLQARYQSELSFQVEGRLMKRLVDVGDVLHKGDPLAILDAKDYALSSESLLNQQKAAESDFKRAQRDLARAKDLYKKNFVGQSELDKAINVERASYATLKALKADYAQQENQLGYAQLLAPADGIVTTLNAEVGHVVKAGVPIATFAWKNDWEFVTAVAEIDVNQLSLGQSAMIKFWVQGDKQYEALVREISPVSSKGSPSYKVKLALKDQPEDMKLGMTGHALFPIKEEPMGLLPTSAIVELGGKKVVMTVDSTTKKVHAKVITLGDPLADKVSIISGLDTGEWVVIAGANKVSDGETVRVLTDD